MYASGYGFDPRRGMMRAGGAPMRFDEYYRCYPMVMAPGNDRPELNYGSKILLPPSALDKVSRLHVQWPLLMELVNAEKDKHSHCGVLEFVAEEGRAYLPQWMMQTLQLDVGDMIQIKTTSLELARLVKLQPQSPAFLDISDPKAVLERAFRNFATLTKGDVFSFEYNGDVYDVAVLEVKPETDKMGVSMIETDVSVDFAAPVGYVEPERPGAAAGGSGGGALPAGGVLHSQGTMAQAINYASIAPGSAAHVGTNFGGEGHRIGAKKGAKTGGSAAVSVASTPNKKPSTPVAGASSSALDAGSAAAGVAIRGAGGRQRSGPQPLRLPANKLFFGYHIRPVKPKDAEAEEAAAKNANKPQYFAGQGHSLRAAQAAKKKGSDSDEPAGTDKKPRR